MEAHSQRDGQSPPLATAELVGLVYERLRSLAHRYVSAERRKGGSMRPTALVHEAYLRLAALDRIQWRGKTHFFAVAAIQMRRILVENARRALTEKRGGERTRITLDEDIAGSGPTIEDVLPLHEALEQLAGRSARQAQVAELRLFAGAQFDEIAEALGVSLRTAKEDWKVAKAWLSRALRSHESKQA